MKNLSASLSFVFLLVSICSNAQTVNLIWAKKLGGASGGHGNSVAIDAEGNVYTTGLFSGTVDFDPSSGTYNLASLGGEDAFVTKMDGMGNPIWAKQMGGANTTRGHSIAVDANGNVHITGFFNGTSDFDPSAGTNNLSTAGSTDIFVSKLDASGNFLWAKKWGSGNSDEGSSIAVDDDGNVFTTGMFQGTVDFDPGNGINNLASFGSTDIFVSKLDASGNFVWAKQMGSGGPDGGDWGFSITVDSDGNIYTTGRFSGTADFDPSVETYNLNVGSGTLNHYNAFISKLDASGNFIWAKQFSGPFYEISASIFVDAIGNVYTAGNFNSTVDFDPGAGTFELSSASFDIFVSKLDASGNFIWAKQMGGESNDGASSIVVDVNGDVYTTGTFGGTADFDPSSEAYELTSFGNEDIFISKLDASGDFLWAKQMGGVSQERAASIKIDTDENIYTTGWFQGTADFDPSNETFNLTPVGGNDVFIVKLGQESPCTSVSISTQPTNQSAIVGGAATFNVVADGTAPFTYQWRKNGINISGANGASYTTPTLTLTDNGSTYSCYLTNCDGQNTITSNNATLMICTAPTIQVKNISFTSVCGNEMTVNWTNGNGSRRIVKINTSNSFTAPVNGTDPTPNATYAGSGQQVVYNGTSNSVAVSGLSSNTTYWFRVYEANCIGTGSLYLISTANQNPKSKNTPSIISVTLKMSDITCFGESDGTAEAKVTGGVGANTFLWNTGATTKKITGLAAGIYTVIVTDANGCTKIGSDTISQPAPVKITGAAHTEQSDGRYTVTLSGTGGSPYQSNGPYRYAKCPSGGNCGGYQASPTFTNLDYGVYTFWIKDANTCTSTGTVTVKAGDCPYPIILIHGLNGDANTWAPLYTDKHFSPVWGTIADTFRTMNNACRVTNAYSEYSTNIFGFDGIESTSVTSDDDVIVNFTNEHNDLRNGCVFIIDMNNSLNSSNDSANELVPDTAITISDESTSSQSAIIKGGYVLKKAIENILNVTGKDKVILAGHSMGGLMSREYLQRTDVNDLHIWWQNPSDPAGHKVVKLFTVGTPHRGSNGAFPNPIPTILWDAQTEAVRDLRYSYDNCGLGTDDLPGMYLFGNIETNIVPPCPLPNLLTTYYNYDVNCDGIVNNDYIKAINQAGSPPSTWDGTMDNQTMLLPDNVRYTYYVSGLITFTYPPYNCLGDIAVCEERQWLYSGGFGTTTEYNVGNSIPVPMVGENYRLSDRITSGNFVLHSSETGDLEYIVRGFDEGDFREFAWKVGSDHFYSGMAQIRPEKTPTNSNSYSYPSNTYEERRVIDGDWFSIELNQTGKKISIELQPNPDMSGRIDLYPTLPLPYSNLNASAQYSKTFNIGTNKKTLSTQNVMPTGVYYFRITHKVSDASDPEDGWQKPYKFKVTFPDGFSAGPNDRESNEIAVSIGNVYPNPIGTSFNLDVFSPSDNLNAKIFLTNSLGQPILERTEVLRQYDNTLTFPAENLLPGMYFLTVQVGDVKKTLKVTKM